MDEKIKKILLSGEHKVFKSSHLQTCGLLVVDGVDIGYIFYHILYLINSDYSPYIQRWIRLTYGIRKKPSNPIWCVVVQKIRFRVLRTIVLWFEITLGWTFVKCLWTSNWMYQNLKTKYFYTTKNLQRTNRIYNLTDI